MSSTQPALPPEIPPQEANGCEPHPLQCAFGVWAWDSRWRVVRTPAVGGGGWDAGWGCELVRFLPPRNGRSNVPCNYPPSGDGPPRRSREEPAGLWS